MPIEFDPMDGKLHSHPDYFAQKTLEPKTIYVNADTGNDTTGDGSAGNPYKTIAKAFSTVPEIINHSIVIKLQAATNAYDAANLKNKTFGDAAATFTLEGTMIPLDSGTVSLAGTANDPVYGTNVQVTYITDLTKAWTPDQFKYKLLRVYKTGQADQYRIIWGNTVNTIYTSSKLSPVPDNTWSYEILDWGSTVKGIDVRNWNGTVYINFVKSDMSQFSGYSVYFENTSVSCLGCSFNKRSTNVHCVSISKSKVFFYYTFLSDVDNTNYDGVVLQNDFSYVLLLGCILRGFRYGIWASIDSMSIFSIRGCRILKDGSTVSTQGIYAEGFSKISFWSAIGPSVIDNGANGVAGRASTRIMYDQSAYLYFGPTVITPYEISDDIWQSGGFRLLAHLTWKEMTTTPSNPQAGQEVRMYMKADKLVVQYYDGITTKYFYLDLTATTNQQWIYTLTPP